MDFKVSRKEMRILPEGTYDVLVDNVCDLYPIFDPEDDCLITDVETLEDEREELLDRSMFSILKQRGNDPVEPEDGLQWAEAIMGDVLPQTIVQQAHQAVSKEGPGVKVYPETVKAGQKESLSFRIELTNAA